MQQNVPHCTIWSLVLVFPLWFDKRWTNFGFGSTCLLVARARWQRILVESPRSLAARARWERVLVGSACSLRARARWQRLAGWERVLVGSLCTLAARARQVIFTPLIRALKEYCLEPEQQPHGNHSHFNTVSPRIELDSCIRTLVCDPSTTHKSTHRSPWVRVKVWYIWYTYQY